MIYCWTRRDEGLVLHDRKRRENDVNVKAPADEYLAAAEQHRQVEKMLKNGTR